MSIADRLQGRRFFITGATGFLGTALVERILRTIPEAQVTVMIRPTRRASAAQRATREILKNDCFDRLREDTGDRFEEVVAARLQAVAGDVGTDGLGLDEDGWAALGQADVVIHSAAAVSFDAPLDQAVQVNLLGPARVATAVVEANRRQSDDSAVPLPHMIAVSTAYVAGTHQGEAREELLTENRFSLDADIDAEVRYAERLREDLQFQSRRPEHLDEFAKAARQELGAAGEHVLAAKSERIREDWIRRQLVDAGTSRALALGWPDAYPFTKALGERLLVNRHGPASKEPLPLSIVRPSIIESALAEPRPGWIRGFRMAEPIIVSYAKGLLREFPGVAEGVIDVIPVDLVVAAIIAVAAHGPEAEGPTVYQVASGVRNPLLYGHLVELVQTWFGRNPLYDDRHQPIDVPDWTFPGRGRVQRQLERATRAMDAVEKVVSALPVRGKKAGFAASIEEKNSLAKRALGYVELYGAYTETEARYRIDHLLALATTFDDDDRASFTVDPAVIDWDYYVHNVHLPSVVEHARVRSKPGGPTVDSRSSRAKKAILSPERQMAVFDLEHTLIASNVVDTYAWLASRHLTPAKRAAFVAKLLADAPALLALDRRDRGDFLRSFYRRYDGAPVDVLEKDAWEHFHRHMLPRSFPDGLARVRAHRRLGHRTLLVTGALDFVVAPLIPLFDDVVCAHLGQAHGHFDGALVAMPPIGEARALLLQDYAAAHDFSLDQAVAYADSASDLAMLEVVGFPVAVNPESRLSTIARKRGWHVEHWAKAAGGSHRPLPLGPLDTGRKQGVSA